MRQKKTIEKAVKKAIEACKESGILDDLISGPDGWRLEEKLKTEVKKWGNIEAKNVEIVRQDMIERGFIKENDCLKDDYDKDYNDADGVFKYFKRRGLENGYAWLFGDGSWS